LHAVDANSREVFKKKLSRKKLIEFMNNLDCSKEKTIIGMEACSGANYFAKKFRSFGYKDVRVVSAQFVKPYVKSNKNDSVDALAITKAVLDPDMRFAHVEEDWQQDIMSVHRVRSRLIKQRTALGNEIRGILAEYGITSARTVSKLKKKLTIELNGDNLTSSSKLIFSNLFEELTSLEQRIDEINSMLKEVFINNKLCQKVSKIPGIGLISSTALVGELGNAANFKNGRELSAYLGLVPKQNSSGGKNKLLGISKRGNKYLRTLLIHASVVS
jgi:transposase